MSLRAAGAVGVPFITAYEGLREAGGVRQGDAAPRGDGGQRRGGLAAGPTSPSKVAEGTKNKDPVTARLKSSRRS
jgi:hypothetical protein